MSDLDALVQEWLEDVAEALDDDPGWHDAAVRIGARWLDRDYADRFAAARSTHTEETK